ncbi:MAG TPA: flagellar basal body rod protein FlgC [Verrucomicrobiales bacterium]|nr:flagellar basal body rod protein FlgC [Verrucomicrobiales bacterium]
MIDIIPGIHTTGSALNAERIRQDAIAQNMANSMNSRGPDGKIYQRQKVIFENILMQQTGGGEGTLAGVAQNEIAVRVETDPKPPRMVPDPSDPGKMKEVPDINVQQEMVDLIISQRTYEANLAVAKSSKTMAMQTLGIGHRA